MIRLKDLLTEITFSGIKPYATQFVWTPSKLASDGSFATRFESDTMQIEATMALLNRGTEWSFSYWTSEKTNDAIQWDINVRKDRTGSVSEYLRIMVTLAEALFDFIAQNPGVESVEMSGYDRTRGKEEQKNRIYADLLRTNIGRINQLGFVIDPTGVPGIVKKSNADSTGIQDTEL